MPLTPKQYKAQIAETLRIIDREGVIILSEIKSGQDIADICRLFPHRVGMLSQVHPMTAFIVLQGMRSNG